VCVRVYIYMYCADMFAREAGGSKNEAAGELDVFCSAVAPWRIRIVVTSVVYCLRVRQC